MSVDLLGPSAASSTGPGMPIYTVSQLNARAKGLLEEEFGEVLVEGEISSWRTYPSGHSYFDLKDAISKISGVMFSGRRRFLRFEPEVGMRVLVRTRVTLYERDGRFQLSVLSMEPLGEGALEVAFRQLMERLEKEGLFAPDRKRPIPDRPRRIALVTSREGAALRDMLRVLRERAPIIEVILLHTLVQGEGAAASIAVAIRRADQGLRELGRPADLIITGRGGGSREDLWAFNEEVVVRAIADCETPILSAVGHEVDASLSDLAADESAATPTAAAEQVTRGWQILSRDLNRLPDTLNRLVEARLAELEAAVDSLAASRIFQRPEEGLEAVAQRMDRLFERMWREARYAERARQARLGAVLPRLRAASPGMRLRDARLSLGERWRRLSAAEGHGQERRESALRAALGRLEAVSPLAVLARGYSLTYREKDNGLIRDAAQASAGDGVRVRLARGTLYCRVEKSVREGETN